MKKIKQTPQQRANTLEALNVMWPSVPPENVINRLTWWRGSFGDAISPQKPPTCGTVACFGGWCAWWPSFNAQGVKVSRVGAPFVEDHLDADGFLFGDSSLFVSRGFYRSDRRFGGTDHQLVTHRLQWLLENSEVVS